MSHAATALLVGLILGGLFAMYVAPKSIREEKIYGGTLALIFHFLGTLGFCMTLPTVITAVALRGGFGLAFPLGVGCVISAFIALLIFAVIEHPARQRHVPEEEVWTADKARSSGL